MAGLSYLVEDKTESTIESLQRTLLGGGAKAGAGHGCTTHIYHGTPTEFIIMRSLQWIAFTVCVVMLFYYAFHRWKSTTGWEEVYVCLLEFVVTTCEIFLETKTPATIYQTNGSAIIWLRYSEWLITCPVLLIHLSNITGLNEEYSTRTMRLLVSDIGCIVFGVYAAAAEGGMKTLFFLISVIYCGETFFTAAKVYIESYHMLPRGPCRKLLKFMAYLYFISWSMFPIIFVASPAGLNKLSMYASTSCYVFADLLSKNLWGILGHRLRIKIREHILVHGKIIKKTKVTVGGEEMEVDAFVDEDDEQGVRQSLGDLQHRKSFKIMGRDLQARGMHLQSSFGGDSGDEERGIQMTGGHHNKADELSGKIAGKSGSRLAHGRVVMILPDISCVDYMRQQFSQLPGPIELILALGQEPGINTVQQAVLGGAVDCVMLHPAFLADKGPQGLVQRLRMMSQRICAFGWAPVGPLRELVEGANLDGWIEGPSAKGGISQPQLITLLIKMQGKAKSGNTAGSSVMPPMVSIPSMGNFNGNPLWNGGHTGISPQSSLTNIGAIGGGNDFYGGFRAPSVLPPSSLGASGSEPDVMLQQLMAEITRLKSELGDGR